MLKNAILKIIWNMFEQFCCVGINEISTKIATTSRSLCLLLIMNIIIVVTLLVENAYYQIQKSQLSFHKFL